MPALVIIFLIMFFVMGSDKKKAKKASKKAAAVRPKTTLPPSVNTDLPENEPEFTEAPDNAFTRTDSSTEVSVLYDGEGESDSEHARHVAAMEAAEAKHSDDIAQAYARRVINRKKLRDAVVMREVLDKPVALRRNPRNYPGMH